MPWLSSFALLRVQHQHTDKELPTVFSVSQCDQKFARQVRAPAVLYRLDLRTVTAAISSAFWRSFVFHVDFCLVLTSTTPQYEGHASQSGHGLDAPVPLCWAKSRVDKPPQKGEAASVLLRRSGPWKNSTNKCNSKVPHVITSDATCCSSWFWLKTFPSLCCSFYLLTIPTWLQEDTNLLQHSHASSHEDKCLFCYSHKLKDTTQCLATWWGRLHFLFQTPKADNRFSRT